MIVRLATALVLIPAVVYVIFSAPAWLFLVVVAALAFACFQEFAAIAAAHNIALPVWVGHAAGLFVLLAPQLDWRPLVGLTLLLMLGALRKRTLAGFLPAAGAVVLGVLYTYGAWRCAFQLRQASPWWIFYATSLNWVGDSAGFYVGRKLGKRRLAPVISPAKTWEGAVASTLFATIFGSIVLLKAIPTTAHWHAPVLSLVASAGGQLGDLVESALKRGAGMKDSGNWLPGHGGWLDRLDSSLFSMPVVTIYLSLVQ